MEETIIIKQAILHILDAGLGTPVLSDEVLEITEELDEYIAKHLLKAFKDEDIKESAKKNENSDFMNLLNRYNNDKSQFIDISKEIGRIFYDMIYRFDIPPADLLVVDFIYNGHSHLAVIKMNYKKSYIHHVKSEAQIRNSIICQPVSLPSDSQKVDEFIILPLDGHKLFLKEKKYDIEGKKESYISKHILKEAEMKSSKEKLKIIHNVAEKVIEKYHPDDIEANMDFNENITNSFNRDRKLDIDDVASKISKGIQSAKEEFISEVKSNGISENELNLNENLEKRINRKQRIITGDGIELKLPVEYFKRKDKFEIINNIDGTISITIKNVEIMKK